MMGTGQQHAAGMDEDSQNYASLNGRPVLNRRHSTGTEGFSPFQVAPTSVADHHGSMQAMEVVTSNNTAVAQGQNSTDQGGATTKVFGVWDPVPLSAPSGGMNVVGADCSEVPVTRRVSMGTGGAAGAGSGMEATGSTHFGALAPDQSTNFSSPFASAFFPNQATQSGQMGRRHSVGTVGAGMSFCELYAQNQLLQQQLQQGQFNLSRATDQIRRVSGDSVNNINNPVVHQMQGAGVLQQTADGTAMTADGLHVQGLSAHSMDSISQSHVASDFTRRHSTGDTEASQIDSNGAPSSPTRLGPVRRRHSMEHVSKGQKQRMQRRNSLGSTSGMTEETAKKPVKKPTITKKSSQSKITTAVPTPGGSGTSAGETEASGSGSGTGGGSSGSPGKTSGGTVNVPNKPKRPLSAYNIFFRYERAQLLGPSVPPPQLMRTEEDDDRTKKRPHRKTHGRIGFRQLARHCANRWKVMDDAERAFFEEKAGEEKKRYLKAMDRYNNLLKEAGLNADGTPMVENQDGGATGSRDEARGDGNVNSSVATSRTNHAVMSDNSTPTMMMDRGTPNMMSTPASPMVTSPALPPMVNRRKSLGDVEENGGVNASSIPPCYIGTTEHSQDPNNCAPVDPNSARRRSLPELGGREAVPEGVQSQMNDVQLGQLSQPGDSSRMNETLLQMCSEVVGQDTAEIDDTGDEDIVSLLKHLENDDTPLNSEFPLEPLQGPGFNVEDKEILKLFFD